MTSLFWRVLIGGAVAVLVGCSTTKTAKPVVWPRYTLQAEEAILLNPPAGERFDASGLLLTPAGDLLTINDRGATLYRIQFNGPVADLKPLPDCFTPSQLAHLAGNKTGHYDSEGIAQDDKGRLYLCEEANRWILRFDSKTKLVERLLIDWSSVNRFFNEADSNASFEGLTMGNGKLYVANERALPLIIVVDPKNGKVTDHFVAQPQSFSLLGTHYSDLSWYEGKLFILCRQHRVVLEVDPKTHAVLAEFDFRKLEDQLGYKKQYPVGVMEGLAVDRDFIWLVTDNNGFGRHAAPEDHRPTLVKCRRPDRK